MISAKERLHNSEQDEKNYIDQLAPVVVFAYNRLDHISQTIKALSENQYASDTSVFIFSDGPKDNEEDRIRVGKVREYLATVTGLFKTVSIVERSKNEGLAYNIMDGATSVVQKHGKVIVVEDDIYTSPYFLRFMNDSLLLYEDKPQVMQVGAYCESMIGSGVHHGSFFVPWDCTWGWATWADRWKYFSREPEKLLASITDDEKYWLNICGYEPGRFRQIEKNASGEMKTWAVFWAVEMIRRKGLVLYPRKSLSKNGGFDGTGDNCGSSRLDKLAVRSFARKPIDEFPERLEYDRSAIRAYLRYYRFREWSSKIIMLIRRVIRK